MTRLRVIGSGEAFDSGLGNTTYLLERPDQGGVLFDCGYQIPERLWSRDGAAPLHQDLAAVCFTHYHADHCFGIVPLLTRYWEENRTKPLTLLGPPGGEAIVKKLMQLGYPGMWERLEFERHFIELSCTEPVEWGGLRFDCAATKHSVTNYMVLVEQVSGAGQAGAKPATFAISGDGSWTAATEALVARADFVFQEVYMVEPKFETHADLKTLVARMPLRCRLIGVAHHARDQKNAIAAAVDDLRQADPRWNVLVPGQVFEL